MLVPKRGDYSSYVREILADGKAHYEAEIMAAVMKIIPPEQATRRRSARQTGSLLDRMISGARSIVLAALKGQVLLKVIQREEDTEGRTMWRMIDQEYLAMAAAVREAAAKQSAPPPQEPKP